MLKKSIRERFKTSNEELSRLGREFGLEALPLVDDLYNTTYWIVNDKRAAKKIINQVFYEAIYYCDVTKNNADWKSWTQRIWMREILDFYSKKENDIKTVFDFIDYTQVKYDEAKNFFTSNHIEKKFNRCLIRLPSLLRIPLTMKDIYSLSYSNISELIDVPDGVIATRIYRARKLFYLLLKGGFNYEEQKNNALGKDFPKIIFHIRQSAMLADGELEAEQKNLHNPSTIDQETFKTEVFIQKEVKNLFKSLSKDFKGIEKIKLKIERKARKRFG